MVFVYHSFGSYAALVYFHLFHETPIKGIMDLGGAPIRFYPMIFQYIEMPWDFVMENTDSILEQSNKALKEVNLSLYQNKYQLWLAFRLFKEPWFKTMFEMNRNLPNVLKLICYGEKDLFFKEDLLS